MNGVLTMGKVTNIKTRKPYRAQQLNAPQTLHQAPDNYALPDQPKVSNKLILNLFWAAVMFNLVFWPLIYFFGV